MADSHDLIDAQFDRAVEIVQSLPKTGPIQTDYEEKLTMYSLFKQATAGNVKSPRPGIWDMLGRAKWDAWAKHKDLDPYEAKWLYVEALLKVLRKYSDKTVAQDLVDELESYGGDPSNIILSRNFARSQDSDGSGSTVSADERVPPRQFIQRQDLPREGEIESSSESESEDEARDIVPPADLSGRMSVDAARAGIPQYEHRPQSSMSSQQRYRTPLTGSTALSPPPQPRMPSQQPLPIFETPSAFAEPLPPTPSNLPPGAQLFQGTPGYPNIVQRSQVASPPHLHPSHPSYRPQQPILGSIPGSQYSRPSSAVAIERAVENMQAHLAALQERLETLEARALAGSHTSGSSPRRGTLGSPVRGLGLIGGRGSPSGLVPEPVWDINDLGMWSVVLNPLSSALSALRGLSTFFARNENRSPSMVILRRLCLDVSFLVCVVAVIGALWRKSGVRRREVKAALLILWRAIVGRPHRALGHETK